MQRELNERLCGHMGMQADEVRRLLDRGADPHWIAPNGISVLEHALIVYWNGEAADLVAACTVPRTALWIAAGLGDIKGVERFIDRHGRPTAPARQNRPPLNAMNWGMLPQLPDPDDEELLLEIFVIALLNGRLTVMEYLASRGFDVDTLRWGTPLVYLAVANGMTAVAECLVRCGADLDLTGWGQPQSAREAARQRIERRHTAADRRLAVVCGVDPDAVRAKGDPTD